MAIETFEHAFYDIDIQTLDAGNTHLIKILAIDGRRFTYELYGVLDGDAVSYIKSVIDAACFGDMQIKRSGNGFDIAESPEKLPKHS